jgi:hypothetical protein
MRQLNRTGSLTSYVVSWARGFALNMTWLPQRSWGKHHLMMLGPAGPGAGQEWLDRGRAVLDRLIPMYRVSGDDQLAFPPPTGNKESDDEA